MTARYFEDVAEGEQLPPFERTTDVMNWNRFAAVNDEFIYIHMDDSAGRAAGEDGAFGMGNLRQSYVLNMLREWAGDEAEIRELAIQYRAINHKNDTLTTHARVVEKRVEGSECQVLLEVGVTNQDGKETAPGSAIVVLPARGGR